MRPRNETRDEDQTGGEEGTMQIRDELNCKCASAFRAILIPWSCFHVPSRFVYSAITERASASSYVSR
jgi:hypothetical protein